MSGPTPLEARAEYAPGLDAAGWSDDNTQVVAAAPLLLHVVAFVTGAAAVHPAAPAAVETRAADVAVVTRACEVAVTAPKVHAPLKADDLQREIADAPAPVKKAPKTARVLVAVTAAPLVAESAAVQAPRREPGAPRGPPAA